MFEPIISVLDYLEAAFAILSNRMVLIFLVPSLVVLGVCIVQGLRRDSSYSERRAKVGWIAFAIAVVTICLGTWNYHSKNDEMQWGHTYERIGFDD